MIGKVVITPSFKSMKKKGVDLQAIKVRDLDLCFYSDTLRKFNRHEFHRNPGNMPLFNFAATSILVALAWQFQQIDQLNVSHHSITKFLSNESDVFEDHFLNVFATNFFNGTLETKEPDFYGIIRSVFDYYFTMFLREYVVPNINLKATRVRKAKYSIKYEQILEEISKCTDLFLNHESTSRLKPIEIKKLIQVLPRKSFIHQWVSIQSQSQDIQEISFPAAHLSYTTEINCVANMLRCLGELFNSKSTYNKRKGTKLKDTLLRSYDSVFLSIAAIADRGDFIDNTIRSARESIFHTLEADFIEKYNQHVKFADGAFTSLEFRQRTIEEIESLRAAVQTKQVEVIESSDDQLQEEVIDDLGLQEPEEALEPKQEVVLDLIIDQPTQTESLNLSLETKKLLALQKYMEQVILQHNAFYECYMKLTTTHLNPLNFEEIKSEWEKVRTQRFVIDLSKIEQISIQSHQDYKQKSLEIKKYIQTKVYGNAVIRQALNKFFQEK